MHKRINLFLALFLAFILVLLFPVFIHTALYKNMYTIIKEDALRSNQALLNQINQIIDSRLQEVEQTAVQLSYHPKLLQIMNRNVTVENWGPTYEQYTEIMDLMVQPLNKNELMHDYYVYFRQHGTIVTPFTKTDPATFYRNYYTYQELDQLEWLKAMSKVGVDAVYLPAMEIRENSSRSTERFLTYIRPFPAAEGGASKGALVILIKESRLRAMLEHIIAPTQGKFIITDSNGKLLATSTDNLRDEAAILNGQNLHSAANDFVHTKDGEELMITSIASKESGWVYYSLVPKTIFMSKVNRVQIWALSLLFICLFFGISGAFMFAKIFYKPVHKLVGYIQKNRNLKKGEYSSEYRLIEETILKSWDSEKQLKSTLSRQTPAIQANLLNRLIKGLVDPDSLSAEAFAFMGIRFESERFAVVVIDIDDCSAFPDMDTERRWAIARGILSNVSQELVNQFHTAYVLEVDRNRLALLVNIRIESDPHAMVELESALRQTKEFIAGKFGILTSLGISAIRTGFYDIGSCHREALQALEYRIITGNGHMIRYKDIQHADPQYFYPIDVELQLMNSIKNGDFSTADRLLDYIYSMNFQSRSISLELGKCLYFNMLSTLLKIWNDLSGRIVIDGLGTEFNPVKRVSECSTLSEMHEETKAIYKSICVSVSAAQKDPGGRLADDIAKFIENHYSDNMLSLNSIAEAFGLTPQYVSQYFKKWKGQNLADFMAKVRVEHTKRLLLDQALTLNHIAEAVGYANDAVLIRVFKKYEMVTPGKYRDRVREELAL
ncbi:MAG: AraC family transcriptional regulator [Paenibacillus sp.]|nr:AraC family transcriptional regulator [Paenibacillus sp.]